MSRIFVAAGVDTEAIFFCETKMVRVRVVETLSQVWKTCILTAVLHSHVLLGWDIEIEPFMKYGSSLF